MTYFEYKKEFLQRHNSDFTVETSGMDQYGKYCKLYICSDGAVMTEINRPVYEKVKLSGSVHGVQVTTEQDIKLFETECWTTDNAESVKFYEIF